MKYLLLIALLLPISANAQLGFPPNDKLAHAGAGYVITNVMLESGYTKKQAFWTVLLLGIVKEAYDDKHNPSSAEHWNDMGANMLGATSAMLVFRWEL